MPRNAFKCLEGYFKEPFTGLFLQREIVLPYYAEFYSAVWISHVHIMGVMGKVARRVAARAEPD
jgi:hypothetical protein